jgi:hypothetical protein
MKRVIATRPASIWRFVIQAAPSTGAGAERDLGPARG